MRGVSSASSASLKKRRSTAPPVLEAPPTSQASPSRWLQGGNAKWCCVACHGAVAKVAPPCSCQLSERSSPPVANGGTAAGQQWMALRAGSLPGGPIASAAPSWGVPVESVARVVHPLCGQQLDGQGGAQGGDSLAGGGSRPEGKAAAAWRWEQR